MGKLGTEEIYKLWDRFEASNLSEMEIETDEVRFVLKRATAPVYAAEPVHVAQQPSSGDTSSEPAKSTTLGNNILAPIVGTFYRSPSPDSEPFVKVGQKVHKGDVVAIIEAMKVMNEVQSPYDGIVSSIEVEDGMLVEYQQLLMKLEAADV